MKRRTCLTAMLAAAASTAVSNAATGKRPIQLHCDLAVDPKKEEEFIKYFDTTFRPVARKHQGFIDLKLLRLREAIRGGVPAGGKFRFSLIYETEELRLKWVASADHDKYWPPLEEMLTDKNFSITVYEIY